ncbi:MAG: HU family DNA-binding protein [Oxalobacteraceae bacterium]|nr:MAG: HU family DNA-binding protein [Oxalobacteraceae bacterium]
MKAPELIDHVAEAARIEKGQAKKAIEAVFAGITEAAKQGNEVSLPSFGKFKVKDSPAPQGRNPGIGEAIEIAASRKLTFAPAKQVKEALAG